MSKPKPINNKLLWGLFITALVYGGLLNSGRFKNYNAIESLLELLLLTTILSLMYLAWKRTTLNTTSRTIKVVQLFRIILVVILFLSIGQLVYIVREHEVLFLIFMTSSIVSAVGLIILTFFYRGLISDESFRNSDKDS